MLDAISAAIIRRTRLISDVVNTNYRRFRGEISINVDKRAAVPRLLLLLDTISSTVIVL